MILPRTGDTGGAPPVIGDDVDDDEDDDTVVAVEVVDDGEWGREERIAALFRVMGLVLDWHMLNIYSIRRCVEV